MDEAIQHYRQCRIQNHAHRGKIVLSITSNDSNKDQLAYLQDYHRRIQLDEPEILEVGHGRDIPTIFAAFQYATAWLLFRANWIFPPSNMKRTWKAKNHFHCVVSA